MKEHYDSQSQFSYGLFDKRVNDIEFEDYGIDLNKDLNQRNSVDAGSNTSKNQFGKLNKLFGYSEKDG